MENVKLSGWIKDARDERDFLHGTRTKKQVRPLVDLSKFRPVVRDQGGQGSCTGHGIGGAATMLANMLGLNIPWFSPAWIYLGGRTLEGTIYEDAGAMPRDCLQWMVEHGVLLEDQMPYNDAALQTKITKEQYKQALDHIGITYYRCVDGYEGVISALDDVQTALESNLTMLISPVMMGTPWPKKWMGNPGNNPLPSLRCWDLPCGGHETFRYGFDVSKKVVFMQNSWGTGWGNQGTALEPFGAYNWYKKYGGYDAQYIRVTWKS